MKGIIVKTDKGYVSGVNNKAILVVFTSDISKAKTFRTEAAVNRWLDSHVNVGMGLSSTHNVKLLK